MTYAELRGALQLIAEESVGRTQRDELRRKDQRFAASIAALKAEER